MFFRPTISRLDFNIVAAASILTAIVLAAGLVYETGGTKNAWPYLILIPVILAGTLFKVPGGVAAALLAGVLLGPEMPIDVDAGIMQSTQNWLVRMGMYILIGGCAGAFATVIDAGHNRTLVSLRTDAVTGLPTSSTARQLLASSNPTQALGYTPEYSICIDFDGYNNILVTFGNEIADAVLRRLADALVHVSGGSLLLVRITSATFGLVAPKGDGEATRLIERCEQHIPRLLRIDGFALTVMPRFGIARLTRDDRNRGELFRKPLAALRQAQANGQRVREYDADFDIDAQRNIALLSDFRIDFEQSLCDVHYQPKIDFSTGRTVGAEALIRWTSAKHGPVSPGRFIPLVENTLMIDNLTRFVIDRSVRTLKAWLRKNPDLSVAVNLSSRNLENEDMLDFLKSVPTTYAVPAHRIELEITETMLVGEFERIRATLHELRDLGFSISVDDYGTGFSSLQYLKNLPIDWVKLDQSFVGDLPNNNTSREISSATASMCSRLGLKVIAEGVESAEAAAYLSDCGFAAAQGYHYARPMPADEFDTWMDQRVKAGA